MKKAFSWIAISLLAAGPAHGASIGLFSTPDCTSCNLEVPVGGLGTFYVHALPEPFTLTGAEFRVIGLPPEWHVLSVRPNQLAVLRIGDPLGLGTNIAFGTGQPGNCVLLFTIEVVATSVHEDVVLQVVQHSTPSNPLLQCPAITFDCPPCNTAVCVAGGEMFVNSSRECSVGLVPATWAGVRRLYR